MKLKTQDAPEAGHEKLDASAADKPYFQNDERRMRVQGFGTQTEGFLKRNNVRDRGASIMGGNDIGPVLEAEDEGNEID